MQQKIPRSTGYGQQSYNDDSEQTIWPLFHLSRNAHGIARATRHRDCCTGWRRVCGCWHTYAAPRSSAVRVLRALFRYRDPTAHPVDETAAQMPPLQFAHKKKATIAIGRSLLICYPFELNQRNGLTQFENLAHLLIVICAIHIDRSFRKRQLHSAGLDTQYF